MLRRITLLMGVASCAADGAEPLPNVHVSGWERTLELTGDVTGVHRLDDGSYEAYVGSVATVSRTDHWMFDHQQGTSTLQLEGLAAGDDFVFGHDPTAQHAPSALPDCRVDRAGMEPDPAAVDASMVDLAQNVSVIRAGLTTSASVRAWSITCATMSWDDLRPVISNSTLVYE